jgi:hypothetical protein
MGSLAPLAPTGFPNVALSNFMKEFRNNDFVGDLVFPRVPVDRQSFPYLIFDRSDQRLTEVTRRAPGGTPQSIRMTWTEDTYFAHDHALKAEIPDELAIYAAGLNFNLKQKSIQRLINKLQLDREVQIANLVTNTANMPNHLDLSTTHPWDDYITLGTSYASHPIVDVDNAKEVVRQSGVKANQMIISDPTFVALRNHPDIIERFKYTTLGQAGGSIGTSELSSVFGLPVTVASGIVLSAANVGSWIWGATCVLAYSQPDPTMMDVSMGKTFVWSAAPGGKTPDGGTFPSTDGYSVVEWRDPDLSTKKDWGAGSWYYALKITATETGFLFVNTCTPEAFGTIAAPTQE